MKVLIFGIATLVAVAYSSLTSPVQNKAYVCTPCGADCDATAYAAAGSCPHCGMPLVEKSSIKFSDLTYKQLCDRIKANPKAILLDVRSPAEFKGTSTDVPSFGHFKNAININVDDLPARIGELSKYKNQEVLVYCSHSHRSPRASYYLTTHGFNNVKNMSGGVSTLPAADDDCLKAMFVRH